MIILGVSGLLFAYLLNTSLLPYVNISGYIAMIFYGIILTYIIIDGVKKSKYFVSWDENEIYFYLPDTDETKVVKLIDNISLDLTTNVTNNPIKNSR